MRDTRPKFTAQWPSLWRFHWHRARAGYDLVDTKRAKSEERFVIRARDYGAGFVEYGDCSERGEPTGLLRVDLIDLGRIHHEIAEVDCKPRRAAETVLPFVNRYGLPFFSLQKECSLHEFATLSSRVNICISILQGSGWSELTDEDISYATTFGKRYKSKQDARDLTAELYLPSIEGEMKLVSTRMGLVTQFQPASLENLIFLRIVQDLRHEYIHRVCEYCGAPFTLENDGRKLKQVTCSPKCKKALWRRGANQS